VELVEQEIINQFLWNNMEKKEKEFDFEEYEKNFDFSSIKFNFKMSDTNFQLDAIQNQLLQMYLISDKRFRRAFNTNFTPSFLTYLKDKTRLNEPVHISIMGQVRGGKSYSAITLCILHQAYYKRLFSPFYICANVYEWVDKLQKTPKEQLINRIFLIDEEKQSVFSTGSVARKMKVQDLNNIVAINNISTLSLNPVKFQNAESSQYGLRIFGRCFSTKVNRLMLYNLQEKSSSSGLPLGNLYLPIFTELMKNEYGKWLEKKYLERKQGWVNMEREGTMDVTSKLKRACARNFIKDKQFLSIKTQKDKLVFVRNRLGSEWTLGETSEILSLTKMMENGIEFNEE
jgi:hypothetical protein